MSIIDINKNIKWVNREDYSYIYNFYTDRFYKLEDISREIWSLISTGSVDANIIIKTLSNKYNETEENISVDVINFLNQLREEKLIC